LTVVYIKLARTLNRHEKYSIHFMIKSCEFSEERKAPFLSCDQDHSNFIHRELNFD